MGRNTNKSESNVRGDSGSVEMSVPILQQDRIVFLSGDVNEHSITNVQAQLIGLANVSTLPITLVVSTYGGSVDEMFSLYDTFHLIKAPVHTVALGKVMSAGVLLLAAGAKGKRLIGRHARIMIHPVSAGSGGNVFEVRNDVEEQERVQQLMVQALERETKMKRSIIDGFMKAGHDCYITAEEAIKLGIVDKLI